MFCHSLAWLEFGIYADNRIARLDNGLWCDAVFFVVFQLERAATVGFIDGFLHRSGDSVGIHNHLAVEVTRGTASRLGERAVAPQKALFVGIDDGNERHFGQVETLAQQVHANQHI